jgi:hypothetical protein
MGVNTTAKLEFTKEAETLLNILEDYSDEMQAHEQSFLIDLRERFDKWGDETYVSEKQINWLRSLEGRYA